MYSITVGLSPALTICTVAPMLLPSGNPFKCHGEVLYLQPTIPPKRFDIFPPDWGMLRRSIGAFKFSLKQPMIPPKTILTFFPLSGMLRSTMATRKCRNNYFPKCFMAIRPFLTRIFFQELFWLEGPKTFLEKFVRCTI